jgi:hypothetical protein
MTALLVMTELVMTALLVMTESVMTGEACLRSGTQTHHRTVITQRSSIETRGVSAVGDTSPPSDTVHDTAIADDSISDH